MKPVLLADDDPAMRRLLRTILEPEGYTLVEADDGQRAWGEIWWRRPGVVLLDIAMPSWNGLDLARAIKTHPDLAGTQVIMVTGLTGSDDKAAGRDAGADHYLTKPFSPHKLLKLVRQAAAKAAVA